VRLPPGRHGLPRDLVRAHQRQRLLEATALAEQGYGRLTTARVTELAGVSRRTFYQHFEDLWACLLAAYESRRCASAARSKGRWKPSVTFWLRSSSRSSVQLFSCSP